MKYQKNYAKSARVPASRAHVEPQNPSGALLAKSAVIYPAAIHVVPSAVGSCLAGGEDDFERSLSTGRAPAPGCSTAREIPSSCEVDDGQLLRQEALRFDPAW